MNPRALIFLFALCLNIASVAHPGFATAKSVDRGIIWVQVEGLTSDTGEVVVCLWNSAEGFPVRTKYAYKKAIVKISHRKALVRFADIAFGTYAISAFHDKNRNGRWDRRILNLPKEAYGFSNDAPAFIGRPSFGCASFRFRSDNYMVKINF